MDEKKETNALDPGCGSSAGPAVVPSAPPPRFDPEKYRDVFGEEVPPEKAEELLRILWGLVCQFVDLGFGIDPVSVIIALEAEKVNNSPSAKKASMLYSEYIHSTDNHRKSAALAAPEEESGHD